MIGVFDSGYGGLTILQALKTSLPEYSYVYFGDNGHAPYGPKSDEEIVDLTKQGVEFLFTQGCNLVILACNTASASALRKLQQEWLVAQHTDKKILGIIVPTIEAMEEYAHETVGVLATKHTVITRVYEIEANKRNMNSKIVQQACNNLAGLIEQHGAQDSRVIEEVKACVSLLVSPTHMRGSEGGSRLDAVLLGCTHYEFVADQIVQHLPQDTVLIRQPEIVAKSLKNYLSRHQEIDENLKKTGEIQYFTTGNPKEVSKKSEELTGEKILFKHI